LNELSNVERRRLRAYLVSAFSTDIVFSIFYIYLPLFAYELGANALEVGLVGGADYLIYAIMPVFFGNFSDRAKSRSMLLVLSLALVCIVSFLYVIASNAIVVAVLRLFEGLGWAMVWPVLESGISETARNRSSASALGTYNFVWSLAAAVGPLVGAVIVFAASIRDTFVFTAAVLLVAILVNLSHALAHFRSKKVMPIVENDNDLKLNAAQFRNFRRDVIQIVSAHRLVLIACLLLMMSVSTLLTFFPPYAHSLRISVLTIGVVTFSFGAARFAAYFVVSKERLRKRVISTGPRSKIVLVALGIASLSGIFLSLSSNLGLVVDYLGFVLLGSVFAIITTIAQVELIADQPVTHMGTGSGILESFIGAGSFIGPVLSGLVSGGSIVVPFYVPFVVFVFLLPFLIRSFSNASRKKGKW
jgi:MFS family permease